MNKTWIYLPLVLAGCGGGGGGSGVPTVIDDSIVILPTYGYQISASPTAGPLTVSIPDLGGARLVTLDFGNTLNGEVNVSVDANNDFSVTSFSLGAMSTLTVDSNAGALFLGAFEISVIDDMQFVVGEPPRSGTFNVITATETVALQAIDGGVQLRLGGIAAILLSWDELENLLDDEQALPWQRRAALATEALEFVFVQFLAVAGTLNDIDDELASSNPLVTSCDAFPGSPPPMVPAQGQRSFTWIGSGGVPAGGDDFLWTFTNCWDDDSGVTSDQLINGSIALNTYVEVIDGQFNLIGTGFDEVVYNNLTIAETQENEPGVFTIDPMDTITINGGFDLALIGITN